MGPVQAVPFFPHVPGSPDQHRPGCAGSEGQQEPVRDNLVLQRLAVHLEALKHRAPDIDEQFPLKQAIRNRKVANVFARAFCTIDADGHKNSPPLTTLDNPEQVL